MSSARKWCNRSLVLVACCHRGCGWLRSRRSTKMENCTTFVCSRDFVLFDPLGPMRLISIDGQSIEEINLPSNSSRNAIHWVDSNWNFRGTINEYWHIAVNRLAFLHDLRLHAGVSGTVVRLDARRYLIYDVYHFAVAVLCKPWAGWSVGRTVWCCVILSTSSKMKTINATSAKRASSKESIQRNDIALNKVIEQLAGKRTISNRWQFVRIASSRWESNSGWIGKLADELLIAWEALIQLTPRMMRLPSTRRRFDKRNDEMRQIKSIPPRAARLAVGHEYMWN